MTYYPTRGLLPTTNYQITEMVRAQPQSGGKKLKWKSLKHQRAVFAIH